MGAGPAVKANPSITSFNAGELSPLMAGRPDLEKWSAGLSLCENMIPRVQGALQRAAGTVFVGEVKDSADHCWLLPFVYSQADAFVLEFGDGYIRFFRDRGMLVTGAVTAWSNATAYAVGDLASNGGVAYYCTVAHTNEEPPDGDFWYALTADRYEIPTPYTLADLTRADGSCGLRFEQSGDVIYIACAGKAPRLLKRLGNLQWVIETFTPEGGPFQDQNNDEDVTVTVTGDHEKDGAVTVTASTAIFATGHVGGLMEIELEDGADVVSWQVRTKTDVGNRRRAGFKFYECTQVGATDTTDKPAICGEEIPVHTRGKYWDGTGEEQKGDGAVGSIGVEWEYLHSGYGWIRITGYTSPTVVTGVVISRLPDELATQATHRWALPAWSDVDGWPDNVCFFRERLSFFRGQQVWHSVSGDFANFRARTHGEVLPDSAVVISIQSAQGNAIEWVCPTKDVLFLGTNGAEHSLKQQSSQQAYGPGNTQQDPETAWGGIGIDPFQVGPGVLFVEKLGRRLRLLVPGQDGYEALDLNKYHGPLPKGGGVVSMAWQQTPHECAWVVMANGETRALTLQLEDKVMGWHRHLSGAEAVAVIPSPDGTTEDAWFIVRREIDGETRRFVEYRAAEYETGDDQAMSVYTQSSLVYDGAPAAVLSGLDHLEGETVVIKVDGAAHETRVVADGSITLAATASKAVVGLPLAYRGQLMPLEAGAAAGTAQARTKRVHAVTARLFASRGGSIGPAFGKCDPLRYPQGAMDAAPDLLTGDLPHTFPGGYEGTATICVEGGDCFPFCLVALFPELVTYEG